MACLLLASILFTITTLRIDAQDGTQASSDSFLVRFDEGEFDNEHGITTSDCMLVKPDGSFHLERRRQQLPSPSAKLSIFESSLDAAWFKQLRDILEE
jgi:hypothetical protein